MTAADTIPKEQIRQACAIPFRRDDRGVEFCLITSMSRGRWMFPKGIIDPGETPEETALKEALEEAGLHGRIVGDELGTYEYEKWGTTLLVTVMLMEVTGCEDSWDESPLRDRCWVKLPDARRMVTKRSLVEFLEKAIERVAKQ